MRRIIALATAGVIVLVLGIAQLVLPGIATDRLKDRLSHSGRVLEVQVHAFPAIKLLWHHADRVVIRMRSYRSTAGHLGGQLAQAGDVGKLDASAGEVHAGLLTLRDASLTKRGDELVGRARVSEADLRSSLPILQSVQPVASADGELTLRGTATLLGVTATVDATVRPQDGAVVVVPDVPFGELATVTVFSNGHVQVQSVAATAVPAGFAVSASGRIR
jgi:hypothetical protein